MQMGLEEGPHSEIKGLGKSLEISKLNGWLEVDESSRKGKHKKAED